jgi:hypothetical protein
MLRSNKNLLSWPTSKHVKKNVHTQPQQQEAAVTLQDTIVCAATTGVGWLAALELVGGSGLAVVEVLAQQHGTCKQESKQVRP